MKAIPIDSLNICIFSFVSFSSVAVMLISRGTPYTFQITGTLSSPSQTRNGRHITASPTNLRKFLLLSDFVKVEQIAPKAFNYNISNSSTDSEVLYLLRANGNSEFSCKF
jgi:hypothetical protein